MKCKFPYVHLINKNFSYLNDPKIVNFCLRLTSKLNLLK